MHVLELRIPPLLLALLFAAAMHLAGNWTPGLAFQLPGAAPLALLSAALAAAAIAPALLAFRRAGTTVDPTRPEQSRTMVTGGIYRISRNPMYLGFALALLGLAIWQSHLLALGAVPLFVLYMNRFQIVPEERALRSRFGAQFDAYAQRTRRWI
ncbi:isoprenylcysteine carboxylmethyltransferase family protein [Chitiniphilus purpureus]|uniref:Isoprenylcysteine carboxylmethyltransferase family protein n=1 Tax=Chitiniphilus purpureus TaxID=2981137 RepID=A0ABY6DRJ4_9NEIS|nr:isoprenylcysteine carboxylmethyltransferase family protein [Chitiniphilus sp. CD1]UXY16992.1 isoprenylcysteine carboxylmethyltransferase family protein [Chitiniphilus sp. CD1]